MKFLPRPPEPLVPRAGLQEFRADGRDTGKEAGFGHGHSLR
jgi:hypothetical protein